MTEVIAVVLSAYLKPRPDRTEAGQRLADKLLGNGIMTWIESRPAHVAQSSRRAWEQGLSRVGTHEATHIMVIQDDVELAPRFGEHLRAVVGQKPDELLTLLYPGNHVHAAVRRGQHWVRTQNNIWAQGLVAPVEMVREFLAWDQRYVLPSYPHDDGRWVMWTKLTGRYAWAPVPSLVRERRDLKSSLGHPDHNGGARVFLDEDTAVDWTAGVDDPRTDRSWALGPTTAKEFARVERLMEVRGGQG